MPNDNSALTRHLRESAHIAASISLWGSSNDKRTSLAEPFTEFIIAVRSQKPYMDLDFMFGALVKKYHTRLDRIDKGYIKFEVIKTYYDILRKLYEEVYQGRPDKLLGDQKNLEAAYLFFLQEARRESWEKRNQHKESDDSAA